MCAAAAAEQLIPNGALMNGELSHDHGMSTEALLRSLKPLLDPTADAEVPASVEEAALVAVGSLGSSPAAASLFFVDEQRLAHDVAIISLGRAGAIAPNECLSTILSATSAPFIMVSLIGVLLNFKLCIWQRQPPRPGVSLCHSSTAALKQKDTWLCVGACGVIRWGQGSSTCLGLHSCSAQ